jgi:hypothetical protein
MARMDRLSDRLAPLLGDAGERAPVEPAGCSARARHFLELVSYERGQSEVLGLDAGGQCSLKEIRVVDGQDIP